ncbi:putative benzoate 4-monooxygenase cytochrome P450 [Rhizodiscina lignyota]|uniref:Benzoate 4-monooxygenase cytochrome P450 n=1 Tax=Rhizodiscina lignyota TaxID=1504668 RepID=A0A9P4IPF0_9PEZI|nr:putative benzoate 4-monooxygenase cytochrome P450 [Rhizodiscina lignyota]
MYGWWNTNSAGALLKVVLFYSILLPVIESVVIFAYNAVYNVFRSPLAAYPGPLLWAMSPIPHELSKLRGRNHTDTLALHNRYGPVVRIAPNELSFNTAQAFKDVFNTNAFSKDPALYSPTPNGTRHLNSARDDDDHKRMRRTIAPAFTDEAVRAHEGVVASLSDTFINELKKRALSGRTLNVDMKMWFNAATFDIGAQLIFGESFCSMQNGRLHPWIKLIFDYIRAQSSLETLARIIGPDWIQYLRSKLSKIQRQKMRWHFDHVSAKVETRLAQGTELKDWMTPALKTGILKDAPGVKVSSGMTRDELDANAHFMIIAASETTATTLSGILYFLCTSPDVLKRLTAEIRDSFLNDSDITFASTRDMKFLNACISEGLRLYPPVPMGVPRLAPLGGARVDGYFVPEGTVVRVCLYACARHASNFASPDKFDPGRWLDMPNGTPAMGSDNFDASQPFFRGPRKCLGEKFAWAQMRMILVKLLWGFDIELKQESRRWMEEQLCFYLWHKGPLWVRLRERSD